MKKILLQMKKQYPLLLAVLFFGIMSACAGAKTTGATTDDSKTATKTVGKTTKKVRTEDLSAYRPKVEAPAATPETFVAPVNHVNAKVDLLLDTLAAANKNIKYAQGYRILVYTGNDRKTAFDLRKMVVNRLPQEREYLTYVQPTFRLKLGDFYTRMEANDVLQRIKSVAPNASIVAEQINVNRPK